MWEEGQQLKQEVRGETKDAKQIELENEMLVREINLAR